MQPCLCIKLNINNNPFSLPKRENAFLRKSTLVQWHYNDNMTCLIVFNEKPTVLLGIKLREFVSMPFEPVIQERFQKCEMVNRLYCWSDEKLKKSVECPKNASWQGDRRISTVCIQKASWCVDVITDNEMICLPLLTKDPLVFEVGSFRDHKRLGLT